MNITRHNYEEFFLLYVDNELTVAQRKAVEAFVEENPDLRPELTILQQSVLPADEQIVFGNKEALLKTVAAPNPVNETNCEEYFVLYADEELTNEQKDQVEQFVYRNPQHQAGFELFQQVRLMPDTSIVYPDKYALYRSEEKDKAPVVKMRWWRLAAAAAVLLLVGGMSWYIVSRENSAPPAGQVVQKEENTRPAIQPVPSLEEKTPEHIAANTPTTQAPDQSPVETAATTHNNGKKKNNQQPPVIPAPVKDNNREGLAGINQKATKNNETPGNIPTVSNVPQKEEPLAVLEAQKIKGVDQTKVNQAILEQAATGRELAAVQHTPATTKPAMPEYDPIEEDIYATTDNRKNRMRGIFRKVSRVFDKATHADTDHEKSSIRIASFEIALK